MMVSTHWNKPENKDESDQIALSRHYTVFHGIIKKTLIYDACTVTFVE